MNLVSKSHWEVRLSEVKVGKSLLPIKVTSAVLDSGTSINYLPLSDYDLVMAILKKDKTCYLNSQKLLFCSCTSNTDSSFPDISFNLSSQVFKKGSRLTIEVLFGNCSRPTSFCKE